MSKWYDKGQLLSRKAFFNMVVGTRGGGKTYCNKTWCIDDYIRTGKQFVWVRRYNTEVDMLKDGSKNEDGEDTSFFGDIAHLYPNHKFEFTYRKNKGKFYCDGKLMGFAFALSTGSIAKSSAFVKVDKIVFDEFLIMGNTYHYLKDEPVMLMELIETIFRNRENDPTAVQPRGVYLLGNNITIANPYFLYFNIPPFKQRFYTNKERGIVVEMYKNEEFIKEKANSHIGKLTKGTKYYDYAIENKGYLDNDRFIRKKPAQTNFYCAIDYKGHTYGFWLDYKNGDIYVNMQFDPCSYNHYSLSKDDHTINTFLIKNLNNTYIKNIVWLFREGCMYFENVQVKNQVYELLSYFVR